MNNLQAQFVTAFVTEDRWKAYLEGLVQKTYVITVGALAFGIVLGILVAVIRTIHDQNLSGIYDHYSRDSNAGAADGLLFCYLFFQQGKSGNFNPSARY